MTRAAWLGMLVGAVATGFALCQENVPKLLAGAAIALLVICVLEIVANYDGDLLAPTNEEIEREIAELADRPWRD